MPSLTTDNYIQIGTGLIALGAVAYSWWIGNKQHKLQERMVLIEESKEKERQCEKDKADIHCWLKQERRVRNQKEYLYTYLCFQNKGQAKATNVTVLINTIPILEYPAFKNHKYDKTAEMEPQVPPVRYIVTLRHPHMPPYTVDVSWEDNSGKSGHRETTVNL